MGGQITEGEGRIVREGAGQSNLIAHRGFSGRYPESTRGAYERAIEFAQSADIELDLECDVQFTADDHLICMHDPTVDRTSNGTGPVDRLTLSQLRALDFGSWFCLDATDDERALVTLNELLEMIGDARRRGTRVNLSVEAKHPTPRGMDIIAAIAALLRQRGWDTRDSPVRLITFSQEALSRAAATLPDLQRTFLTMEDIDVAKTFIPRGTRAVGPDLELLRRHPGYVRTAHQRGVSVHVWLVNTVEDVAFCYNLGVDGYTTDHPDLVNDTLRKLRGNKDSIEVIASRFY